MIITQFLWLLLCSGAATKRDKNSHLCIIFYKPAKEHANYFFIYLFFCLFYIVGTVCMCIHIQYWKFNLFYCPFIVPVCSLVCVNDLDFLPMPFCIWRCKNEMGFDSANLQSKNDHLWFSYFCSFFLVIWLTLMDMKCD